MFFKRKPAEQTRPPEAKTHVVYAEVPSHDFKRALAHFGVRHGMWVLTDHGVGIVRDVDIPNTSLVVALAHPDGTTNVDVVVPVASVKQATYEQIPVSRRENLSREAARSMGYL